MTILKTVECCHSNKSMVCYIFNAQWMVTLYKMASILMSINKDSEQLQKSPEWIGF